LSLISLIEQITHFYHVINKKATEDRRRKKKRGEKGSRERKGRCSELMSLFFVRLPLHYPNRTLFSSREEKKEGREKKEKALLREDALTSVPISFSRFYYKSPRPDFRKGKGEKQERKGP